MTNINDIAANIFENYRLSFKGRNINTMSAQKAFEAYQGDDILDLTRRDEPIVINTVKVLIDNYIASIEKSRSEKIAKSLEARANRSPTAWDDPPVGANVKLRAIKDITDSIQWNDVDNAIWGAVFKWAQLSAENTQIYVRTLNGYIPVAMNEKDNGVPVAQALNMVKTKSGKTLSEWITDKLKGCNEDFLDSVDKTDLTGETKEVPTSASELIERAYAVYPASLLHHNIACVISRECQSKEMDEHGKMYNVIRYLGLSICREPSKSMSVNIGATDYDVLDAVASELKKQKDLRINAPIPYSSDPTEPALCHFDIEAHSSTVGPTPAWDEYMRRFKPNQAEIFMAAHYARFYSKNKSRQAVWLYDDGGKGKSVYCDVIEKVLMSSSIEQGFSSIVNPVINFTELTEKSQFFHQQLVHKSIILFRDCMLSSVTHQNWFRNVTGGDAMNAEMKHKNGSIEISHRYKILICSNKTPDVNTSAMRDTSRIILLRQEVPKEIVEKITFKNGSLKGDPSFIERLLSEHDYFLAKCKEAYKKRCPNDANIDVEGNESDFDMSEEEQIYNAFIAKTCVDSDDSSTTREVIRPLLIKAVKDTMGLYSPKNVFDHFQEFCRKYFPEVNFVKTKSKGFMKIEGLGIRNSQSLRTETVDEEGLDI